MTNIRDRYMRNKKVKVQETVNAPTSVTKEMRERFHNAIISVTSDRDRPTIGTLSEKTIHAVIKNYIEPDEDKQEIPIDTHVADVFTGDHIYEIQTGNLKRLCEKLSDFLPMYKVTVVHPIIRKRKIFWIDPDTGEMSNPRCTSPKVGSVESAIREVYGIREYINDPNLSVRFVVIDADEFRIKDGYGKDNKKHGTWLDKVPTDIIDDITFECPEDYLQLLPSEIPEEFTVNDAASFGMKRDEASLIIAFLCKVNVIEKIGNRGRSYLYRMRY